MQTIIRHTFTPEEVAAALIENVPKAQEIQVRYVDGYVEIDIVNPAGDPVAPASADTAVIKPNAPEPAKEDLPKAEPETPPPSEPVKLGKNAQSVMDLCALGGFQVYLDVDSPDQALAKVLTTCCVENVTSFDNNKTALSVFKDMNAEFTMWCGGAD